MCHFFASLVSPLLLQRLLRQSVLTIIFINPTKKVTKIALQQIETQKKRN